MKQVISTENIPIKMWLDEIEDGALSQAKNLANLPFVYKHVAIMPDAHQGYGMPIGGVIATKGVIIPNAVGVDIGCGMCALQLPFQDIKYEILKEIVKKIRQRIPTGFKHQERPQDPELMPGMNNKEFDLAAFDIATGYRSIINEEYGNALKQLGTLGGGNHFIEIQKGSDGYIWVMVHSGSRNLGYKVAKHYNNLAKEMKKKWYSSVPSKWQLSFLPLQSELAQQYQAEMNYCVKFAYCNRKLMMERVLDCFKEVVPEEDIGCSYPSTDEMINIAHNYAVLENHFGMNVMVHRKGATLAREGTIGIIPGSQGSKSYIVEGKGNPESFHSCSHGAGRKMSRTKAIAELSLEEEQKKLDDRGILHAVRGKNSLDEAPGAYKDISVVMENQKDLVDIVVELEPLAVVKG